MRNAFLFLIFPVIFLCVGCALSTPATTPQTQTVVPSAPTAEQPVVPVATTEPTATPPSAPISRPLTVTVSIANFAFDPAAVNIKVGDTVKWINDDAPPHRIMSDSQVDLPDLHSNTLNTGDSYSYTFQKTGTFNYHCQIHPSMKGTVIVR